MGHNDSRHLDAAVRSATWSGISISRRIQDGAEDDTLAEVTEPDAQIQHNGLESASLCRSREMQNGHRRTTAHVDPNSQMSGQ